MKYVALLRGIGPSNPNMRNERLRAVVEELGFEKVETVISSGNVLFDSDRRDRAAIEAELEEAWVSRLGFESATIVRSQQQLAALVEAKPFGDLEHSSQSAPSVSSLRSSTPPPTSLRSWGRTYLLVTFCKRLPKIDWQLPYQPPGKPYRLEAMVDGTIFSVTDVVGAPTADLMGWLDQQFGKGISSRTWKTVNRILARMS